MCTEVEKVFSEINLPTKLQKMKMRDLLEVWDRILLIISNRDVIVGNLEDELNSIELERVDAVSSWSCKL